MAKSPYSSAGGGSADKNPHEFTARKGGGACRAGGGAMDASTRAKGSPGIIDGEKGRKSGGSAKAKRK
jgi:hypothetical protein